MEQTIGGDKGGNLGDQICKDVNNVPQESGKEIHDRLEGIHSLFDCICSLLILLEGVGEFHEQGYEDGDCSHNRGCREGIKPTLDTHHSALGCIKTLFECVCILGESLECGFIVAHIPLIVALEGIHLLEFVIDLIDLPGKFLESLLAPVCGDVGVPEFLLECCHPMHQGVVGL